MLHIRDRPSRRRCRLFSGSSTATSAPWAAAACGTRGSGNSLGMRQEGCCFLRYRRSFPSGPPALHLHGSARATSQDTQSPNPALPAHRRPALAVGATLSDAGAGRSWPRRRGGGGAGGAESGLAEQRDAAVQGLGADGSGRVLLGARGCRRWGRTAGAAGVPGRARICPSSFYSTSCITLCSA